MIRGVVEPRESETRHGKSWGVHLKMKKTRTKKRPKNRKYEREGVEMGVGGEIQIACGPEVIVVKMQPTASVRVCGPTALDLVLLSPVCLKKQMRQSAASLRQSHLPSAPPSAAALSHLQEKKRSSKL